MARAPKIAQFHPQRNLGIPGTTPAYGGDFHVAGACFVKPGGGAGEAAATDPPGGPFTGGAFWGVFGAGGAG